MGFVPQVVDINGDGNQDIISGAYGCEKKKDEYGRRTGKRIQLRDDAGNRMSQIFVYYGNDDGTYEPREQLAISYEHSAAVPVDFDDDGDLDLICSAFVESPRAIAIVLLENVGTVTDPRFAAPIGLVDHLNMREAKYSSAIAYDWDKDGLLDLVAAGYRDGCIYFHKNIGSEKEPKYDKAITLIQGIVRGEQPGEEIPWGKSLFLSIVDWDGDSVDDILAGDYSSQRVWKRDAGIVRTLLRPQVEKALAGYNSYQFKLGIITREVYASRAPGEGREETRKRIGVREKELTESHPEKQADDDLVRKYMGRESHGKIWVFLGVKK